MPAQVSDRVRKLLSVLTIDEKAALSAGSGTWHTVPLPEHGVGRVKVTDGPTGARGDARSGASATCFPVGVALGATWSTELLGLVGAALADEARSKGAHVLLGPTVNLQRTPIGGRGFECYSEDPMLTARLGVAFVSGLQDGGIGACIKHYVGNDVEFDRHEASADMDHAVLREVALLPFELAVADVDVWSVMAAYNRVDGEYATAHRGLLTDILKEEWSWAGAVISDWGAVRSTAATGRAGLDLEMPGPARWLGPRLAEAVRAGEVSEDVLDDLAARMLHLAERSGRLDDQTEPAERSVDDPGHRALTRRAAAEATVLLRNDGVLPLDPTSLRRLAVIGPNVAGFMVQGGGSSQVVPHAAITGPLEALAEALGPDVALVHEPGCTTDKYVRGVAPERWEGGRADGPAAAITALPFAHRRDDGPVLVEAFGNQELDGDPVWSYRADDVTTVWFGQPRRIPVAAWSARLTARYVPAVGGPHTFGLAAVGPNRLFVDGRCVLDHWAERRPGDLFFANASAEERAVVELAAGVPVEVVVEYANQVPAEMAGVRLGIAPPEPADLLERAVAAAAGADAAIVIVGTTADWETEGNDRSGMDLPGRQDELVRAIAAANPRTAVVVNAGSPVTLPWAGEVGALAQVWFGGQEMGHALADVLLGRAEPGGRLPHTVPVRLEDHPAAAWYPAVDGRLVYGEGLRCGHRWYDDQGIEPRFPFGHGLSYTTFAWGEVLADADAARLTVTNVGDRAGSDVVQVYIEPPAGSDRPARELKGFAKVHLAAGESTEVVVDLGERAFRRWGAGGWTVEPGTYRVVAGASSRDLRSSAEVTVVRPA